MVELFSTKLIVSIACIIACVLLLVKLYSVIKQKNFSSKIGLNLPLKDMPIIKHYTMYPYATIETNKNNNNDTQIEIKNETTTENQVQ